MANAEQQALDPTNHEPLLIVASCCNSALIRQRTYSRFPSLFDDTLSTHEPNPPFQRNRDPVTPFRIDPFPASIPVIHYLSSNDHLTTFANPQTHVSTQRDSHNPSQYEQSQKKNRDGCRFKTSRTRVGKWHGLTYSSCSCLQVMK